MLNHIILCCSLFRLSKQTRGLRLINNKKLNLNKLNLESTPNTTFGDVRKDLNIYDAKNSVGPTTQPKVEKTWLSTVAIRHLSVKIKVTKNV